MATDPAARRPTRRARRHPLLEERRREACSRCSLRSPSRPTFSLLCGDLTDYGLAEEARILAKDLAPVKIPVVAVLGNHDFEAGEEREIAKILTDVGVHMLDGDTWEFHGVGFAGVRGFCGGFGRGALGPWGEKIIKDFVHEAVQEALKLESALARLTV